MTWITAARTRITLLFAPRNAESRMMKEFGFHIEMETERLQREEKLPHIEARRRALVAFGGVENYKEELRDGRGLRWLSGLTLDLKLGFRMLRKYPGLTAIGVLSISSAVALSTAYMESLNDTYRPTMPGMYGARIVRIYNWDLARKARDSRTLPELFASREHLTNIEEVGAFRQFERNLISLDGTAEPVKGAEISASGLRVQGVAPLLGRGLRDDDEVPGATDVVVLGQSVWKKRFHGDSAVIGKTIRLGNVLSTIVGVMPEGFSFPSSETIWTPLHRESGAGVQLSPPLVGIFGRLKPGVSLDQAQSELTSVSLQTAQQSPAVYRNLRPRIKPYLRPETSGASSLELRLLYALNLLFLAFLAVCCANVGTLVFARTATRESELTIRNALGASRKRIVTQLFAEALVLTTLATTVGVLISAYGLKWISNRIADAAGFTFPFWWNDSISPSTVAYAAAMALVAAVLIGVVPALKATGRELHTRLKSSTPGGSTLQFGPLWTAIIVSQVTTAVLFLFIIASVGWNARIGRFLPESPVLKTAEYLTLQPLLEQDSTVRDSTGAARAAFGAKYVATYTELERRLRSEPGVTSVTHAAVLPGMEHTGMWVDVDGKQNVRSPSDPHSVQRAEVAMNFFEAVDRPMVSGRSFSAADMEFNRNVVVVDEQFVQRMLRGENAIGRRIRQAPNSDTDAPGEWTEIVGVVSNLTQRHINSVDDGKVYYPLVSNSSDPVYLAVHVTGDPKALVARVRALAVDVDPALRLQEVLPMNEIGAGFRMMFEVIKTVLITIGVVALLLSTAGVYSLMSFTVAHRTREIGIRSALGANPTRIARDTFGRGIKQIGAGILGGSLPGGALIMFGAPEVASGAGWFTGGLILVAIAAFVAGVGLMACIVPARRALRIQPTEALKSAG